MKINTIPLALLWICLLTLSCSKSPSCDHQIRVAARDGNNSQLHDAMVYIYDGQGKLVGFHQSTAGAPINMERYRYLGFVKVVVWANSGQNPSAQSLSNPLLGSSINDLKMTQNPTGGSFDGKPITHQPSDIFFSSTDYYFDSCGDCAASSPNSTLYVNRSVASYQLTIRNIGKSLADPLGDYKVVVRHPYSNLDSSGQPTGTPVNYLPIMHYDAASDELTSDINLALPTGSKGLTIDIYSNGLLVYTTTIDSLGRPLTLVANKLHNILIDFKGTGIIELVVSEWGETIIFEKFE